MSTRQVRLSTRSKSCGRQPEKEPHFADAYAKDSSSLHRPGRSKARAPKLPSEEVNITEMEGITSAPSQVSVTQTEHHSADDSHVNNDNTLPVLITCGSTQKSARQSTPPAGVSDNRGSGKLHFDSATDPISGILNKIKQAKEEPDSAIMLVLAELREIKTQMINLSNIETTTASLVEQLAASVTRTGELETKLSSTVSRTEELELQMGNTSSRLEKLEGNSPCVRWWTNIPPNSAAYNH